MTLMTAQSFQAVDCPYWARRAHRSFTDTLTHRGYPCYFGSQAARQDTIRYTLIEGGSYEHVARDLTEFVAASRSRPEVRLLMVVLFDRTDGLVADEARFWRLLRWLRQNDPSPWPPDIPDDYDDPRWEFCFAGDPMFAFPSMPGYRHRLSRRIGDSLSVCFQPRRIFAGIERSDPGGEAIRRNIYRRVHSWDAIPAHPALVDLAYGEPEMREWKQYVLPDENSPLSTRCPLQASEEHG